MIVNETGGVQGPQPIQPQRNVAGAYQKAAPDSARKADKAEISTHARLLSKLTEVEDVRQEKVADIRAQIEAGTYESDEKLSAAVDRLLEDL
ncbi:MAG: flagellar biosynthesis anti-sigma factor FlgM [Planctomycetota bacterium]